MLIVEIAQETLFDDTGVERDSDSEDCANEQSPEKS